MSIEKTKIDLFDDSQKMQVIIDDMATQFDIPVWKKYMSPKYNRSLDIKALLAIYDQVKASTVIDYSSGKPIRTRPSAAQITAEMCKLGNSWQMNERDIRAYDDLVYTIGQNIEGVGANELVDFFFGEMRRAALEPHQTINRMVLQGMSENKISVTASNNKGGIVWEQELGIEEMTVDESFDNATALPMDMFKEVRTIFRKKGTVAGYATMNTVTFEKMMATTQMKNLFLTQVTSGGKMLRTVTDGAIGVDEVNIYLTSKRLPIINIEDTPVTTDAGITYPFIDDRICFSETLNMGNLYWTNAMEAKEGRKNPNKSYALSDLVLISKYSDGTSEITENELNAMPIFSQLNKMLIVNTDA